MKMNKKTGMEVCLILGIIFFSFVSAGSYSQANPNYGLINQYVDGGSVNLDHRKCEAGQDFVLQISPFGCTPPVVRSDLLEEQNVPVFCAIAATQVNPLIDVEAIEGISFSGEYPKEVSGIGFHPARAALGTAKKTNYPLLENIGYAVIVLKKQPNESAMPDFVEGNLTAKIRYDIKNAFGVGNALFYLPEMDDAEFELNKGYYKFWKKFYLRAERIEENYAVVSIYDDSKKISTTTLKKGETSGKISVPGFGCMAKLQLRLDALENPGTTAKLDVNGEIIELVEGQKFLENKCQIVGIEKQGLVQKVKIKCYEDEKSDIFELKIVPRVRIEFDNDGGEDYGIEEEIGGTGFRIVSIKVEDKEGIKEEKLIVELQKDDDKKSLRYGDAITIGDKSVRLLGFAGPQDSELAGDVRTYYESAMKDYETIINSFSSESCDGFKDCGEKAFIEEMKLAYDIGQSKTFYELCKKFDEKYPDSDKELEECSEDYKLSSNEPSSIQVLINGEVKDISFIGVIESSFDDYGARVVVDGATYDLIKDKVFYLADGQKEYLQLLGLEEDYAKIKVYLRKDNSDGFVNGIYTLKKGIHESFGSVHDIYLGDINLRKYAKVSVISNIDNVGSVGNFGFKIGIEKRAIKLAPEKIQEKIDSLNETIYKWEERSENLGQMVKGLKGACVATSGFLIAKNFLFNSGDSLARKDVMDIWNKKCTRLISEGKYRTHDECYADNDKAIDDAVKNRAKIMKEISGEFSKIQDDPDITTEKWAGLEKEINDKKLWEKIKTRSDFLTELKSDLKECYGDEKIVVNERESFSIDDLMEDNKRFGSEYLTITQLRDLMVDAKDCKNNPELAKQRLNSSLKSLWVNSQSTYIKEGLSEELEKGGFGDFEVDSYGDRNAIEGIYYGGTLTSDKILNSDNEKFLKDKEDDGKVINYPVQIIIYNNQKYLVLLEPTKRGDYIVDKVYEFRDAEEGKLIVGKERDDIRNKFKSFTLEDRDSYNNPFKASMGETKPVVRYFETEPHKGLPAVVPFDLKKGWYVYVSQDIGFAGGTASYDDSGAVRNYYICNVGKDGIEDGMRPDDKCRMINKGTGQLYNRFGGLDESEAGRLVKCAEDSIVQASRQYGKKKISISTTCGGSVTLDVGSPAVDIPSMQCQNFMSPSDCQILFNVCDPVICPSSRCDFGGRFPVKDVVQSGIIGSLLLCLPNFGNPAKGGVAIPICLTGLKAGIDGLLSVYKSYRDCLQESLDTGKTVGICDEIYSIHLCEFMWRQALPLAKYSIPKIIEFLIDQNARGGGEYFMFRTALNNMDNSMNYFTNYYAANAFKAFKVRSVEEVGTEVCRNYISGVGPNIDGMLESFTEPDSPAQFHGRFDEIPFTTATVPATSHYKVFYHIYAGKDSRVYYSVYLRGAPESSYYMDSTQTRIVDSGYIKAGEYVSQTKDFTAPSGYKEMCIRVNEQEECGFKEVSTSFAVNYVKDSYTKSQATEKNIQSESECISGTVNTGTILSGALSSNLQEGAEKIVNPKIYERGIIRICAHDNPGIGTDAKAEANGSRWVEVGYCDKDREIKCWLDTESVKKIIRDKEVKGETLEEINSNYMNILGDTKEAKAAKEKLVGLGNEKDSKKIIQVIDEIVDDLIMNKDKAHALLLRAQSYGKLAIESGSI